MRNRIKRLFQSLFIILFKKQFLQISILPPLFFHSRALHKYKKHSRYQKGYNRYDYKSCKKIVNRITEKFFPYEKHPKKQIYYLMMQHINRIAHPSNNIYWSKFHHFFPKNRKRCKKQQNKNIQPLKFQPDISLPKYHKRNNTQNIKNIRRLYLI